MQELIHAGGEVADRAAGTVHVLEILADGGGKGLASLHLCNLPIHAAAANALVRHTHARTHARTHRHTDTHTHTHAHNERQTRMYACRCQCHTCRRS
jgi:hypothetical protein